MITSPPENPDLNLNHSKICLDISDSKTLIELKRYFEEHQLPLSCSSEHTIYQFQVSQVQLTQDTCTTDSERGIYETEWNLSAQINMTGPHQERWEYQANQSLSRTRRESDAFAQDSKDIEMPYLLYRQLGEEALAWIHAHVPLK